MKRAEQAGATKTPGAQAIPRKKERFCREYLVDYNATQAAMRAGYSAGTAGAAAARLLRQAEILERIHTLQAERLQSMAITQDYVVEQLVRLYQQCTRPESEEDTTFKYDSRGALRALELLGKCLGVFGERTPASAQAPAAEIGKLDGVLEALRGE
ncbi:MAG: terminase small subunit [Gemmiger sp.]|nr:terminase small subunit [Gemmiger sp.]